MNTSQFQDFRTLMQGIHDFYRQDMSAFALDVWWTAMRRYELDDVQRALSAHCVHPDSGQFLPKPADVVRQLGGTTNERATGAWAKVLNAISQVGPYRTVVFDDPLVHAVITDMGGWVLMCAVKTEELPFKGREFERRYLEKLRIGVPTYLRALIGITDQENLQRGGTRVDPILIGKPEEARRVYERGGSTLPPPVTMQSLLAGAQQQLEERKP